MVAEVSQIFLWNTNVLPKLVSCEEHCRRDKPITVLLQCISDVSAINPLVAFYDINRGKREVEFFYFVPDTTRDCLMLIENVYCHELKTNTLNSYTKNML
jgi:hypothetical protein